MFWNAFDFEADKIHIYQQESRLTLVLGTPALLLEAGLADEVARLHRRSPTGLYIELFFDGLDSRRAFLQAYAAGFELVLAAGGRVWNDSGQLLLIHRRGRWDLPKGKVETGEALAEAARREVEEETGIRGLERLGPLPSTLHIYAEQGRWVLKHSVWFDFIAPAAQHFRPQIEEDIHAVGWYGPAEREVYRADLWPALRELVFNCPPPANLR